MNGDVNKKRNIIGSIYPEKIVFDGFQYRTAKLNEVVELIYNMGKGFNENKTGQKEKNFDLSSLVPKTGFEPAHGFPRCDLNTVRLPISPLGHKTNVINNSRIDTQDSNKITNVND